MNNNQTNKPKLDQSMTLREAMDWLKLTGRLRVHLRSKQISDKVKELATEKVQLHGRN